MSKLLVALLLLAAGTYAQRVEWDAQNYPNPTTDGYQKCQMRSPSSICDPDAVLTEQQRLRLQYELTQLESRTRQLSGADFCEKKGITGAIAVAKKLRGGSENAAKLVANQVLQSWTLDSQCQKAIVVVMASEDRRIWIARNDRVPVYATELTEIAGAQKELFRQGDYPKALLNILQAIWEKALSKQTSADDGRSRGTPFVPGGGDRDRDGGGRIPQREGGGGGFKIPGWLWLLFFLVIIPTLLCCCCVYCCCCRGKGGGGGGGGGGNVDPEQGGGGARRGGGGGGNPLSGFLSGMGGAAAMNGISSSLRGRGGGGRAAGGAEPTPPPYNPGYTPGVPQQQPRLYPSVPVKDEGGGTQW